MEKFSKIHGEMVFKDCKAERDCEFLVKISSRLYKIVKSCGPLYVTNHSGHYIWKCNQCTQVFVDAFYIQCTTSGETATLDLLSLLITLNRKFLILRNAKRK